MFANKTCAVQILLVAFSRLMCCSLVCKAKRYARAPFASTLSPTNLPGIVRSKPVRTARNPACGPPNPIGTPNLCADPTAASKPHSPGALSSVKANKSVAAMAKPPCSFISAIARAGLRKAPVLPG